ncbi:MAG: hypothetical protein RML46_01960 [Anaerolineae bacterium]|nr:hypothetical protein [Anaerolineae bacterium]MDW8067660.1 hypothetical protein [Anaerolineae bacterium]
MDRNQSSLDVLESLLADLLHPLGWVAAQALLLVQPLLAGWVDESIIDRAIRRLEGSWPQSVEKQE